MRTKLFLCAFIVLSFMALNLICKFSICAEKPETIQLSQPRFDKGKLLMESLKERQTNRSFSSKELPLNVLSNLLWAADGINRLPEGKRTAPSASNRQEIDIYVAMKQELYLYNTKNTLEPILARDIREFTGKQAFTKDAPIILYT